MAKYGKRIDNTNKDVGYLGEIRMPNGRDVMTEFSVGMPNTEETFRPAIVPGMHPADINYMRETEKVPEDVYAISQKHAEERISEGKSPFYSSKEKKYKKGGKVNTQKVRGHGIEQRGKTKGRFI
jgi:hypothetical protein